MAKVIFKTIEIFAHNQMQNALKEMVDYSKFDQSCNLKLKKFTAVLMKLAHWKERRGLYIWYENTIKPVQTIKHSHILAFKLYKSRF
jgi:hypothetical protein